MELVTQVIKLLYLNNSKIMEKQIKLVLSPFNSNVEVIDEMVISIHVPYSDKDVNIQINPNIQEYKENDDRPGLNVRQVTVTTATEDTKTLHFDFLNDNIKNVQINNKEYEIKLLNIGKENIEGQDFSSFEFYIKW